MWNYYKVMDNNMAKKIYVSVRGCGRINLEKSRLEKMKLWLRRLQMCKYNKAETAEVK